MRVLIAVDDSPRSQAAAAEAAALLSGPGTEFHVLSVAEDPPPWVIDPLGISVPGAAGHWIRMVGVRDPQRAGAVAAEFADALPRATNLVAEGDPVVEICRAADRIDADVIVVGAVERGILHRLVDPPVADDVVHATRRPVLVVHGEEPTCG